MLSIRSYRGNQTESPQRILHLHDCLMLNSGLRLKRITMLAPMRLHTIIRHFSKLAAKKRDFFKPQQGPGNDFVACLFQTDKVFPLHFKAQTCARCICTNEFYTLSSLHLRPFESGAFLQPLRSALHTPTPPADSLYSSSLGSESSPRSTLSLSNSISFNSRVSIFCRGPGSIAQIRISTTSGSLAHQAR